MAWKRWMSQSPEQRHQVSETGQEARAGRLATPVLLIFGAGLTLVGLFLAGVMIWASQRTLPIISDQPASRTQGAAADLSPESAPNMSDIPPANPAYPAPVEGHP